MSVTVPVSSPVPPASTAPSPAKPAGAVAPPAPAAALPVPAPAADPASPAPASRERPAFPGFPGFAGLPNVLPGFLCPDEEDFESGTAPAGFRAVDRAAAALGARATQGLSPIGLSLAVMDWWMHLAAAPGKQAELAVKAWRKAARFTAYATASTLDRTLPPCIQPLEGDERFSAPSWQDWPFRFWYQGFLLNQQWWHNATHGVPGVSPHSEAVVAFAARQMLDMVSPSNAPFTNPEVLKRARQTLGGNFVEGARNFLEDQARKASGQPPVGAEAFTPGKEVAATPGEVIYRNHLIELIQYRATTRDVHAEPILIVPAWIMKYYILDLSPHNSLIRYLVDKGHTVFCISWRNVGQEERNLGLEDYRKLGVMAALDAVSAVVPGEAVHAVGYCLGGTLLAIAAAAMARAGDARLKSMTLFAAQTDFSEPGELQLFVDPSALYALESTMWDQGYLSAGQMAGAFQMLRSNDLVWSRMVREYLMGERAPMNDLMAWNADATRLPYRMHSEYLRQMFLENDLAAGRYQADGRPVALQDIRVPLFVVGTERDHVAPWKSVYKIHQLTDTDVTFVLASGGHNAGIVSEPGHKHRHYRIHETRHGALHVSPEEWMEQNPPKEGSWWPAFEAWLSGQSTGRAHLPYLGTRDYPVLGPAPGTYVMQR
ncbi:alpha/beta fold hydrolase [Xanthobacter sp. KR7-225]|uniref:PHA/PHB synthase family protein n=1 Tax=Xanthobacter sp. KR7-225 TaxID=3156613 RepID=UPI0032B48D99